MEENKRVDSKSESPRKRKNRFEYWHQVAVFLILYDLIVVTGSYFAALWLRFDCHFSDIPIHFLMPWLQFAPVYAVVCIVTFWKLRLYQSMWRYVSFVELERISIATVCLAVFHAVFITVFPERPTNLLMIVSVLRRGTLLFPP